jgi:catechol 2,3-dioxygenase-like lactoylglutathione lyase family enzyme
MTPTIEKISAITFRVLNMQASVQFYRNVLGMELLYGGERASFSSLRANDSESAILNLERVTVCRGGPADLPRYGCGCVLDTSEGERI